MTKDFLAELVQNTARVFPESSTVTAVRVSVVLEEIGARHGGAMATAVSGPSVTDTIHSAKSSLVASQRRLQDQVRGYTEQLTATFAALRRKHFP